MSPRLSELPQRTWTHAADPLCGPIAFTRPALGAKWGEYLRVTVSAPFSVEGEARVHVGAVPQPLAHYAAAFDAKAGARTSNVIEFHWEKDRIAAPSAIPEGRALVVSLSALDTVTSRDCSKVRYTVEQGALQPNVGDAAWLAVLANRPQTPEPTEDSAAAVTKAGPTFAQLEAVADSAPVAPPQLPQMVAPERPFMPTRAQGVLGACLVTDAPEEDSVWFGGVEATARPPSRLAAQVELDEVGVAVAINRSAAELPAMSVSQVDGSSDWAGPKRDASATSSVEVSAALPPAGADWEGEGPHASVTSSVEVSAALPPAGADWEGEGTHASVTSSVEVSAALPPAGADWEGEGTHASVTSSVEVSAPLPPAATDWAGPKWETVNPLVGEVSTDVTLAPAPVAPSQPETGEVVATAPCGSSASEWALPTQWNLAMPAVVEPVSPPRVVAPPAQVAITVDEGAAMGAFFGFLFDVGARVAGATVQPSEPVHGAVPVSPRPRSSKP